MQLKSTLQGIAQQTLAKEAEEKVTELYVCLYLHTYIRTL